MSTPPWKSTAKLLSYQWVSPTGPKDEWPPVASIDIRCAFEPGDFAEPEHLRRALHDALRHLGVAVDQEIDTMPS